MNSTKSVANKKRGDPPPEDQSYHVIFDQHAAIMLLIEPQTGIILDANQAAVIFYGYPKSRLCGMSIDEINILSPEQVSAERQKALEGKQNFFIFTHRLASGEERIVEVHSSVIPLQDKPVLFSIIHDITEKKQTEEALRINEVRYRSLFENGLTGILITHPDGAIFSANPEACRLLGRTEADICRDGREKVVNLTDPRLPGALAERARIGWVRCELTFVRADGTIFPVEVVSNIVTDPTGQVQANIFFQDITERKREEDALKKSEAKYRLLFENMEEGFSLHEIITDKAGKATDFRFLDANDAYGVHTGLKPQDCIGKTIREIMPQADPRQIENYGKVALTGEPLTFEYFSKTFNRYMRVRAFSPQPRLFATILKT